MAYKRRFTLYPVGYTNTPDGLSILSLHQPVPHLQQYTIFILHNAADKIKEEIRGIETEQEGNMPSGLEKDESGNINNEVNQTNTEDNLGEKATTEFETLPPEITSKEISSSEANGFYKWFDLYKNGHPNLSSDYNCLILEQPLNFECSSELNLHLKDTEGNILLQSYAPNYVDCVLFKATEENLWEKIASLIEYNEQNYRKLLLVDLEERLKHTDYRVIKQLWEYAQDSDVIKKYAPEDSFPAQWERLSLEEQRNNYKGIRERFGIESNDSKFTIRKKLLAKLDQLVALANKIPEANRELVKLLNEIPVEYFAETMKRMKPSELVRASLGLNPEYVSQKSPLRIEFVEKDSCQGILKNQAKKNDGKYILFLCKGDKQVQVRFSNKYSFIVYLLYAIDRYKKGENVQPLALDELKDEYIRLYRLVYPHDIKCQSSFEQLIDTKNPNESAKRTKLDNCLSEIRLNISQACEQLEEDYPSIHYIPNQQEHLYTRSANIHIPYSLL